jgi:hypothetical protein
VGANAPERSETAVGSSAWRKEPEHRPRPLSERCGNATIAKSRDAAGWYRSFLDSSIIPNAHTFGVLIEIGEITVGLVFILGGVLWLARWSKLSDRLRVSLLGTIMAAALAATFMAVNFHLASGGNHPWLIPKDGFDETIDVDSVLAMIQIGFMIFCGYLLTKIRREHRLAAPRADASHGALPAAS